MRRHLSSILVFATIVFGIVASQQTNERSWTEEFRRNEDYGKDPAKVEIIKEIKPGRWSNEEKESSYWHDSAQEKLKRKLRKTLNTNIAKNVIFFMGDGMSISTLTAARIYQGQLDNEPGEEGSLIWDKFDYSALVKTWCIDSQVADSACSSTAYLGGIKGKLLTLGLNGNAKRGFCETQIEKNHVDSIAKWAQDHGKASGIVTTTRITDASPAGLYAHAAHRFWETDSEVRQWKYDPKECRDIATQLVKSSPGKDFKVILGGGRRSFLPKEIVDDEGQNGRRSDGINLIEEWKSDKQQKLSRIAYIENREGLQDVIKNPEDYDDVLGLFESSHMNFHLDKRSASDPTISEMTEAAIKILQKENNGFFLFVEGGRIDDAHHQNYGKLALDETVELAKAVEKAMEMTSELDTLIVVTADHGHTMTFSGYPRRGDKITGMTALRADDNIPYGTLSYANGPGYRGSINGLRHDPAKDNYDDIYYHMPAMVPIEKSAHGGEDVAIFASGPWAHLFTGTIEQSDIPHFLGYASCIGKDKAEMCNRAEESTKKTSDWKKPACKLINNLIEFKKSFENFVANWN